MQISFVMLFFLLFSNTFFFGGGGKLLERKASSQPNNVSKHRNELFSKETLTNSCTVFHRTRSSIEHFVGRPTGLHRTLQFFSAS